MMHCIYGGVVYVVSHLAINHSCLIFSSPEILHIHVCIMAFIDVDCGAACFTPSGPVFTRCILSFRIFTYPRNGSVFLGSRLYL